MKPKQRAFTLIELLVVIAIIGLLATISVIALNNARAKGRDAKRVADVKQMQTALELYFNDMERYPTTAEFNGGSLYSTSSYGTTTYMAIIPAAPNPSDGNCSTTNAYVYSATPDGTSYTISYCIGNTVGALAAGPKCATPAGISTGAGCGSGGGGPSFACGGTIAYTGGPYDATGLINNQGGYYRTVNINGQCWLKDNLNVGTMINGATGGTNNDGNMTDNSILEKYCYYDNTANCVTDGGLYQFDEAMQYGSLTPGAQGICPSGWHIPTDAEQNTLDQALNDTTCNANRDNIWDCANAGTKLQAGGTSGFEGLLAGDRDPSGSFVDRGSYAYFWSSSVAGSDAWDRYLYTGLSTVDRRYGDRAYGLSVRCVED